MKTERPSLVILTHSTDDFWKGRPFVQLLIPRWEAMGIQVAVVTDADPFVPADAALLHVDLSVVPDSCRRLAERYPLVLNGGTLDIRKRRYNRLILSPQDPYTGPVIVKTDWNHCGIREFRRDFLESRAGRILRKLNWEKSVHRRLSQLETRRRWRRKRLLPVGGYPIYPGRESVPRGVWENPNLVVERFTPERVDGEYRCRHWLFFGSRELHRLASSPNPVVKSDARLETLSDPIPEELRTIRAQMGFDFGKFDYGLVDGRVVLYDVNRTPGTAADPRRHSLAIEVLSGGLRDMLESGR